MKAGSYWFNRLVSDAKKMSPHIRFVPIKAGFYRIYYLQAYMGECYKNMPETGFEINERAMGFENYDYYQAYHDNADTSLRVKNFVEGYWETYHRLRLKVYQFTHDKEFFKVASEGYKQMRIK